MRLQPLQRTSSLWLSEKRARTCAWRQNLPTGALISRARKAEKSKKAPPRLKPKPQRTIPPKEESVQDIAPEAEAEENDKPENSEAAQETPAEEIENTTKEKMKEKPAEETPIEENKSQTIEEIKQD